MLHKFGIMSKWDLSCVDILPLGIKCVSVQRLVCGGGGKGWEREREVGVSDQG